VRLRGHFAIFDQWTRIDSLREGKFLERIAPGAFKKTINERREHVRVLLNHGFDPELGDRPLGPLEELREDSVGGRYEVPLLDGVPELVVSGLRAGLYGASFRFEAIREDYTHRPGRSAHNPEGLPERTLREVRLHELGPVTFPAYAGATASVRSACGEELELRVAGRKEVLPDGLPRSGADPIPLRRLRAISTPRACELVRALEQGKRVELTWGRSDLGRVLETRAQRPRSRRFRDRDEFLTYLEKEHRWH
jgi:HK97 family phage prohead protease